MPTNVGAALVLVAAGLVDGTARTALWAVAAGRRSTPGPTSRGGRVHRPAPPPGRAPRADRHHRPRRVGRGHRGRRRRHHRRLGPGGHRAGRHGPDRRAVVGLLRPRGRGRRGGATAAEGAARARLARDVYSYLHIPLVLGIVLAAVGIHEALVHPASRSTRCSRRRSPAGWRCSSAAWPRSGCGGAAVPAAVPGGAGRGRGDDPRAGRDVDASATAGVLAAAVLGVAYAERTRSGGA